MLSQKRKVALSVDGNYTFDRIHIAIVGVHLGAISVVDNVAVGHDAIRIDEEATTARQFLSSRVKRLNGYCRGFNTANKFRQQILRLRAGNWNEEEGKRTQD